MVGVEGTLTLLLLIYTNSKTVKQYGFLLGKIAAHVYLKHDKGIYNRKLLCGLPDSCYSSGPIPQAALNTAFYCGS